MLVGIEIKPCNTAWSMSGGDKELSCKEKKSGRGDGREGGGREGRVSQEERSVREEWARERASECRRGEGREERIKVSKNDKAERRRARE